MIFSLTLDGVSVTEKDLVLALEKFHISSYLTRPVAQLSAGQKRKVALTRLFFNRGKALWLLDEPLTALDKEEPYPQKGPSRAALVN